MKLDSIILCIIFTATGVVEGASRNKMVLNTTTYTAATPRYDKSSLPRASDAKPTCSFQYGLAHVNETVTNIGHLSDVANITCSAPAASCARVSHEGESSIFFCNFIIDLSVQESQDIETRCGNLIQPAKQVSDACSIGNSYTYGYVSRNISNGSQSHPVLVAIGADYAFAP
ncbi:hypothetical protein UA08_09506 [Talaromyces atroroseus]|uniref:Ecp2 effector protein domain-containing protein n=1 Tax=Talaromyces atroroseus TaxID=1441469 RepID=A0A1Q5Q610_TALAT|nr:hypothetical protein UA08_09506 [Talaromyces atroroseus]OKL55223.1 hypothetical protein UA08_09506 [Talaromyces atroroseus]